MKGTRSVGRCTANVILLFILTILMSTSFAQSAADGVPVYHPGTDSGVYLWRDANDNWHLRATAGGGFANYRGYIVSSQPFSNISPYGLEDTDVLDVSDPKRLGFDLSMGGLFSKEYQSAPWSMNKFVDLLKHLWVPMVVLGTSGTAGLIRTVRANLLDELHKPYVVTARSKGMAERKLVWKYPVRVALNPFFSGIGGILPALISGASIVSVVLSLPTTGPLMLRALMTPWMMARDRQFAAACPSSLRCRACGSI